MPKQVRVFYAYPHEPPNVGETISSTISKLKTDGALKPESTEGGRLVSILKWPEGAPLNLG